MNKGVYAIASGAAAAAIVGTAVYLMTDTGTIRKLKKTAAKTIRAMENIADDISVFMR